MTQPTDEEIRELWSQYNPMHGIQSFARAVLEKWGAPQQAAPAAQKTEDVHPRHPTVIKWRNAAIEACARIAEAYGHHDPARDMRMMLTAPPQAAPRQAAQEPSHAASDAYNRIDRFLRRRLDDHDYAHYSFDLDLVFGAAQQAAPKVEPVCVDFGMSGTQMYFKIGNQLFKLAYEPEDNEEFEFMKRMLLNAFSKFAPQLAQGATA